MSGRTITCVRMGHPNIQGVRKKQNRSTNYPSFARVTFKWLPGGSWTPCISPLVTFKWLPPSPRRETPPLIRFFFRGHPVFPGINARRGPHPYMSNGSAGNPILVLYKNPPPSPHSSRMLLIYSTLTRGPRTLKHWGWISIYSYVPSRMNCELGSFF